MKKRAEWADIAKFVAITLMVSGHLGLPHHLSVAVHMFHMPIFFILGGVFYSKEKYQKFSTFFLSRVKSLLVPYFAWGIISYVVYRLIPNARFGELVTTKRFFVALFTQDANIALFRGFGVIQWFFTSLFFSEIAMWLIIRISDCVNRTYRAWYFGLISVLLIIVNSVVCHYIEPNWLGMKSSILGTLFCLTGWVLKDEIRRLLNTELRIKAFAAVFALVVFTIVFLLNGNVNMRTTTYNNSILFILGATSGTLIIFIISRMIGDYLPNGILRNYILYIGRNTALILCVNRLVQHTFVFKLNELISVFINIESRSGWVIKQSVDLIVEMLLFVPIIYFVNRWIPFTLGKARNNK